jgi:CRISPR system Cascade subunit CasE
MIAGLLQLSRADVKALNLTDPYALHRVVYGLFEDVRTAEEKQTSNASGILYADKGGDFHHRNILFLANRPPISPAYGKVSTRPVPDDFLSHQTYRFEVAINPTKRNKTTGKLTPIRGRDDIAAWFLDKAPATWGFSVVEQTLVVEKVNVLSFKKKNHTITQGQATLKGVLTVQNIQKFTKSFQQGIGRGRAFGCGLLQIVPQVNPFEF